MDTDAVIRRHSDKGVGMREIKFRAWHRKRRNMTSPMTLGFLAHEDIEMLRGYTTEYDWMQYTGLHDKNGKEIYEGDIVRFFFCADHPLATSPEEDSDITEMIDEVKFMDGGFFFWCEDVRNGAMLWRFNERCEVIGNIYENPELLK